MEKEGLKFAFLILPGMTTLRDSSGGKTAVILKDK